MKRALPDSDPKDTNFVFLVCEGENLPVGAHRLVLPSYSLAAWGSIAAALEFTGGLHRGGFSQEVLCKKKRSWKIIKCRNGIRWDGAFSASSFPCSPINIGNSLTKR